MSEPTPFVSERYLLAESPYWSEAHGGLFWVDILGQTLCFSAAGEPPTEWRFDQKVTCCAGARDGRLVVALAKEIVLFDPGSGARERLCEVEPDQPRNRCNDGGVDPLGNFWFGTMDDAEQRPSGALYCLPGGSRQPVRVIDGVGISNTLAWDTAIDRMYFADSARREMYALDIAWDAGRPSLAASRVLFSTPEGEAPDGSCLDREGRLYNARWGGGVVAVSDRDGNKAGTIALAARYPTSCCFGGESRGTLFITTAAPPGLDDAGEFGGAIFATEITGERGPDEALFAPC